MKTSPVTVDSIDISVHQRYANDQALLDPIFLYETPIVAAHPEIVSISSIYASKWEELFEVHRRSSPWASFCPPKLYAYQSKRFFSYCLLPTISYNPVGENTEKSALPSLYEKRLAPKGSKEEILEKISQASSDHIDLQEEGMTLSALIDTIVDIDKMLAMIHGNKAKQKG